MTLGPLMVDIAGTELSAADREVLQHPLVGSVLLFSRNYRERAQLRALIDAIHAVRSPALLIAVDQEGGRVQRFREGFSPLPPLRRIGHAYDDDAQRGLAMARALGWLMAAELLACGLDFSFAPCVDLDYGLSEIIGDRAFHSRAAVVAPLAVAYAHGMRDAGMAEAEAPGRAFLDEGSLGVPGSALTVTCEGSRPLAVEVQALRLQIALDTVERGGVRAKGGIELHRCQI